jgi:hypothetical protein
MLQGVDHATMRFHRLHNPVHVHGAGYIQPAFTDKDAYPTRCSTLLTDESLGPKKGPGVYVVLV